MNAREKAVSYGKLACSISAPRDKRNIHIYLKRDAGCKGALGHQLCDLGLVLWLDAIPKFLAELFHTNEAMLSVRERVTSVATSGARAGETYRLTLLTVLVNSRELLDRDDTKTKLIHLVGRSFGSVDLN